MCDHAKGPWWVVGGEKVTLVNSLVFFLFVPKGSLNLRYIVYKIRSYVVSMLFLSYFEHHQCLFWLTSTHHFQGMISYVLSCLVTWSQKCLRSVVCCCLSQPVYSPVPQLYSHPLLLSLQLFLYLFICSTFCFAFLK